MRLPREHDELAAVFSGTILTLINAISTLTNAILTLSFQELDAHSVYHLLPLIEQPILTISGFFDMLIPVNQSAEIAWRVSGDAVHYCCSTLINAD